MIAQFASGLGIILYTLLLRKDLRPHLADLRWNVSILREIGSLSLLTCMQQSVMNFGILMVQGLVNRFGPVIMAAFAAAVKIDSFAYMPVQDFGNAFFHLRRPKLWSPAVWADPGKAYKKRSG